MFRPVQYYKQEKNVKKKLQQNALCLSVNLILTTVNGFKFWTAHSLIPTNKMQLL